MAHRGGLKELEAGHYYATVNGTRYEMLRARQPVPPGRGWDLYVIVDGEREFIKRAPTLETHRQALALSGSTAAPRRRPVPVPRDVMLWTDLAEALAVAAEQARQIELPVVQRALRIAGRVTARRLGHAVLAAEVIDSPRRLTSRGDAWEAEYDRLLELRVSIEIALDQARWVGAGAEAVARAMAVAIAAVTRLSDHMLDTIVAAEALDAELSVDVTIGAEFDLAVAA